jgi:hypothetical protein
MRWAGRDLGMGEMRRVQKGSVGKTELNISFKNFAATSFNIVLSGAQPRQFV